MKKYLLTALLGVFAFVGFVSASWESNCEISQCVISPKTPEFDGDYNYKISGGLHDYIDFRLTYSPSSASISPSDGSIECSDGLCSVDNLYDFGDSENNLYLSAEGVSFSSCVFVSSNDECTLTWVEDSSEESGTLLSGGISQLSPVITSISTVMGEFIPYVVYIGIGILLCTLGFTAIKWLVNWFSRKITKYFK